MAEGKWVAGLTPGMPVAEAAIVVLAERFAVVREFLPLAAEQPDAGGDHVHQLRVGTRRAGAALQVFANVFPRKHLRATKRTLRTLRKAAGDARDWDVILAALPTAKAFTASPAKPALDFLLGYAFGERAVAQERLVAATAEAGPLFAKQSEELPNRARAAGGTDAPANFGVLAGQQLGSLFRALTAGAEANPTEPAAMHALRITAKQLRYAIEIFADCFPPLLKENIYPSVEHVQELLGEVQDATVGTERLAGIRARVGAVMPKQLTRVKKGIDGLAASFRAKVPAGKKTFAKWRTEWLELMTALKLEVLASTV